MAKKILTLLVLGYACAAPADNLALTKVVAAVEPQAAKETDLKTDASSYYDRYPDYSSRGYSSGYGVTGYGTVDDRFNNFGGSDNIGYGGFAGSGGLGSTGYSGYDGYRTGYGNGGYGVSGSGGYAGYGAGVGGGYGSGGYGAGGSGGYSGYGAGGSGGYSGYGAGGSGGYSGYGAGGSGGYGGYAGSGGLNSYYGYNSPNYQGAYHLGYGYYNKRPGYGNIYNSGITPSLVTGYRGYSK